MQGYGLFTIEEMVYSPTGTVFSRGPGKILVIPFLYSSEVKRKHTKPTTKCAFFLGVYKIPGFADIPAEFNVSLLKGAPNPRAVYSSKAVGEPPLFLASSVLFAIKEAIKDARREEGLSEKFQLFSPATSARIRMACRDRFIEKVENK